MFVHIIYSRLPTLEECSWVRTTALSNLATPALWLSATPSMTTFKCYLRWLHPMRSDWSFSVPVPILFRGAWISSSLRLVKIMDKSWSHWNEITFQNLLVSQKPRLTNTRTSFFIGNLLNLCDVTWRAQIFQAQKSQALGTSFQETKLDRLVHIPVEWCTWGGGHTENCIVKSKRTRKNVDL